MFKEKKYMLLFVMLFASAAHQLCNAQDTSAIKIRYEYGEANSIFRITYWDSLKTDCEKLIAAKPTAIASKLYLKYLGGALNNLGYLNEEKGNIPKALEYYTQSLKVKEQINDKEGIANCVNNIAFLYSNQGEQVKALEYYNRSLNIRESIGDKSGVAESLNNIGYIYSEQRDFSKALDYYIKSLKLKEEVGDKNGVASCLNNIGTIYKRHGDPSCINSKSEECLRSGLAKASEYLSKSLKIYEEIGSKNGIATTLNNIGEIYIMQKNYARAAEFCLKSMQVSKETGNPINIRNAARQLNKIYKATGNYKNALQNYELFILMRDSISNQETKKASIKNQLKYEYEKRAAADSVKNAEEQKVKDAQLTAQNAQIKHEKFQRYALLSGLVMVLVGFGFVINRFRITQRQKKIIERQKIIVDEAFEKLHEKNKEILDSIHYAKRIQTALLPNEKYIVKSFNRLMKNV